MNNYFNEKSFQSIDPKGRLLLPKEVRSAVKISKGDILYLLPNLTAPAYLEIRTRKQWNAYLNSLRSGDGGADKKDSFRYAMMAKEEMKVDGTGRVLIPTRIRVTCQLDGQVAVINMDSYIEVWNRGNVEQRYADMIRAFKETNDRMF